MRRVALLAVMLALAAPASAAAPRILPARDLWPVWSPDRRHIAFTRVRGTADELVVVNAHDGVVRRLASNAYRVEPSWSPDGSRLAFQAHGAIWTGVVAAFRDFSPTRLTRSGERTFAPRWNPRDAETIAYLTTFGARNTDLWELRLTADGIERSLLARDAIGSPDWDPAGGRLAFQRDDGIFVLDVQTGSERRIATVASPGPPSFSHDGMRLAYATEHSVWVAAADGASPPAVVSPELSGIGRPSWSQSDDALVYLRAGGLEQTTIGEGSRLLSGFPLAAGGLASVRPFSNGIAFSGPRLDCPGHSAIRLLELYRFARTLTGSCIVAGTARADAIEGSLEAGDDIRAGAGNDTVHANDGHTDRVDCGPGRDVVYADRRDTLRRCEVVHRSTI